MPSAKRRPGSGLERSGPAAIVIALIAIGFGLLTGSLNLDQALAMLRGQATAIPTVSARSTSTVPRTTPAAARFDYYLLALSWSPEYCAGEGSDDRQQCTAGMRLGFVLHGLWPQSENSSPGFCSSQAMPQWAEDLYPNVYPTDDLLEHEWEKHGTCTGLSPEQYLALSKRLKEGVRIPDAYASPDKAFRATTSQVEAAFVAANPGFSTSSVAVICTEDGRYLREVYACFDLNGTPTACDRGVNNDAYKTCRNSDFQVRSPR